MPAAWKLSTAVGVNYAAKVRHHLRFAGDEAEAWKCYNGGEKKSGRGCWE